jgi:hypothetical protein
VWRVKSPARWLDQRRLEQVAVADRANAKALGYWEQIEEIREKTEKRIGRPVPHDPLLLDVLANIQVQKGDRWIWRGARTHAGLPIVGLTVNGRSTQTSAIRYLAISFGVIAVSERGQLVSSTADPNDINPFHRLLRSNLAAGGRGRRSTNHRVRTK